MMDKIKPYIGYGKNYAIFLNMDAGSSSAGENHYAGDPYKFTEKSKPEEHKVQLKCQIDENVSFSGKKIFFLKCSNFVHVYCINCVIKILFRKNDKGQVEY